MPGRDPVLDRSADARPAERVPGPEGAGWTGAVRPASRGDVAAVLGLDGRVRCGSAQLRAAVGADGPLVGRSMGALVGPVEAPRVDAAVRDALRDGASTVRASLTDAGGGRAVYELAFVRLDDGAGAALGVSMAGRDVSDRADAEAALQLSEVRFRSFVEATTQVVWMADATGEVTELGQSWAQFTGQTAAEIEGWGWTDALHPDDLEAVMEGWTEAIAARGPYEVEYRVRSREGAYHWFAVRAVPASTGGTFLGWVGTCTDVEAERRHEAELVEAARAAEEAARMKSALLANLSHEIRTPLTSIIGFADILAEEHGIWHTREPQEYARLIGQGGRRLLETLTSVLDLAQIEAGRRVLRLDRIDVRAVVTETADLLRPQAEAKGLAFRCDVPAGPAIAWVDRGALSRVLTNLLGNAVKFTPEGEVRLALAVEPDHLVVTVADTGVGMSEGFLPVVFDEFRQESEGQTRRYEGNGLGLAITRRLVEMLGGRVGVESEPGAGSTFTVRLPRSGGGLEAPAGAP